MRIPSQIRRIALFLTVYLVFCSIAGVFVADGALHPARRPLPPEAESAMRQVAADSDAELQDASIIASDGVPLRAWEIQPHNNANGTAAILLHGPGTNRPARTANVTLLLRHALSV